MLLRLHGKVDGKRVELDSDPGLPPDSPVAVELETAALSTERRRRRIMESFGAWAGNDSIVEIFAEIERERATRTVRSVPDFDVTPHTNEAYGT